MRLDFTAYICYLFCATLIVVWDIQNSFEDCRTPKMLATIKSNDASRPERECNENDLTCVVPTVFDLTFRGEVATSIDDCEPPKLVTTFS